MAFDKAKVRELFDKHVHPMGLPPRLAGNILKAMTKAAKKSKGDTKKTKAAIVEYLAAESAGRCGPCRFGLPSLAAATQRLAAGVADRTEVERLAAMVDGRGACAHPDGTVRLVRSMLVAAADEVARHAVGRCRQELAARPSADATVRS